MEEEKRKPKLITVEEFSRQVDDIIVDENRDCKADLFAIRIYGITMVIAVAALMFLYKDISLSLPIKATIVIASIFIYQAIHSIASISTRTARKTAALVAIFAVFSSAYQEMSVNAIREFFVSINGGEPVD